MWVGSSYLFLSLAHEHGEQVTDVSQLSFIKTEILSERRLEEH